ncbi:histidine kinase [Spongiactinospora sp. TRM90649]|nr:histidine kinase [Spongiactinospora sp. TRM90649]
MIAGSCLVNGLYMDQPPLWRQALFGVFAVVAYLHGRHLPVRQGVVILLAAAVPGAGIAVAADFWAGVTSLVVLGVFVALPWLAGRFRRQQAELVRVSRERADRLEREREFVAERVRYRERARIAQDMHDSLGHDLALIALRAGALELASDMGERNREAAALLRASAVAATERLSRTIGVLREEQAPIEPPDESVEALVARAREAGMAVDLRRDGPSEALPPLLDRAVHRVVRESLTNAARHAPGADVLVRLERTAGTVTVSVVSTPARATPLPPGGGTGLAGLRERVRLLGGTLRAGPNSTGFAVTASLPSSPEDQP